MCHTCNYVGHPPTQLQILTACTVYCSHFHFLTATWFTSIFSQLHGFSNCPIAFSEYVQKNFWLSTEVCFVTYHTLHMTKTYATDYNTTPNIAQYATLKAISNCTATNASLLKWFWNFVTIAPCTCIAVQGGGGIRHISSYTSHG